MGQIISINSIILVWSLVTVHHNLFVIEDILALFQNDSLKSNSTSGKMCVLVACIKKHNVDEHHYSLWERIPVKLNDSHNLKKEADFYSSNLFWISDNQKQMDKCVYKKDICIETYKNWCPWTLAKVLGHLSRLIKLRDTAQKLHTAHRPKDLA